MKETICALYRILGRICLGFGIFNVLLSVLLPWAPNPEVISYQKLCFLGLAFLGMFVISKIVIRKLQK